MRDISEMVGVSGLVGVLVGAVIVIIIAAAVGPSGTIAMSKECLNGHPNICRDITTFTTEYTERKQ